MTNWVIPCSTAAYDVIGAFQTLKRLDWKQSTNVEVDSLVYIYVSAPISAIKFYFRKMHSMKYKLDRKSGVKKL